MCEREYCYVCKEMKICHSFEQNSCANCRVFIGLDSNFDCADELVSSMAVERVFVMTTGMVFFTALV
jgi:hypothetical protein